jgi:4-amino-4-deoxy-L-arabinose transferase-like glycosyltransferase
MRRPLAQHLALGAVLVVAVGAIGMGIVKSLPYSPEVDEPAFVLPAMHIAATGDLNPHWFGHPGATVIYPLALVVRVLGLVFNGAVLAGRVLSGAYAVGAVGLVYALGAWLFGRWTGVAAAFLAAIVPIIVSHAQVVRTDSAATFWTLLSLFVCLRLLTSFSLANCAAAGLSIGCAVATRYFEAALVPVLLGAIAFSNAPCRGAAARGAVLGCAAVAVGFLLISPFAMLDFTELRRSLAAEAETSHLGADGLSRLGNFVWYLTRSLPENLTYGVLALAVLGVIMSMRDHRRRETLLLLSYLLVHLVAISLSNLHWHRWTIQALPILCLYAGYAGTHFAGHAGASFRRPDLAGWLATLLLVGPSVQLGARLLLFDLQQAQTPPRILAREWLRQHIPPGATVYAEAYGPPLEGISLRANWRSLSSLSERPLGDYTDNALLVVSSAVYDRYFMEAERYPEQVQFYQQLFDTRDLLAEFRSSVPGENLLETIAGGQCSCSLPPVKGAPSIHIYAAKAAPKNVP